MRVLMLGWDFSPRLSGGVGSACQGLATALTRAGTSVLFVLPRLRGDEEAGEVQLLAAREARAGAPAAPPSPTAPPLRPAPPAQEAPAPRAPFPAVTPSATGFTGGGSAAGPLGPALGSPSEALRLLAIDSPLRPYLSAAEYERVVAALLGRVRASAAGAVPREQPPPALAVLAPVAGPPAGSTSAAQPQGAPQPAGPRAEAAPPQLAPRPYGGGLLDEVERYARQALAATSGESFDVIHAHDWMTFPAALLLRERTGKPLLVHFHSSEFERRGARASREVEALEQAALQAADRVLCVSRASAETLRDHYALEWAKVRVLHNAYSPLAEAPRPAAAENGAGGAPAGAAERDPVVLYLGRLADQKAPELFLQAAARVRARLPRARFVMSGSGELYPEVLEQARTLGLEPALRFTGHLDGAELAQAYADADLYVMSSPSEPFGISALEALSMGVPTLVSRRAGVTEVVRSVLRFEPGDVADLADKMHSALAHPGLRRTLVEAGLREVRGIRWDRPARALAGIYDEVAP